MNLAKLYEAQAKLDADIVDKKQLQGKNLLPNKILALNVELGELAQEVQGEWKFWKEHTTRDNTKVLDEFVDCLHFILSIGLEDNDIDIDRVCIIPDDQNSSDIVDILNDLFTCLSSYGDSYEENALDLYENLFTGLMVLGFRLGLTYDQIEAAYFNKNEINHERQEADY